MQRLEPEVVFTGLVSSSCSSDLDISSSKGPEIYVMKQNTLKEVYKWLVKNEGFTYFGYELRE